MKNRKLTKDELNLLLFIKKFQHGISEKEIMSYLKQSERLFSEEDINDFDILFKFGYIKLQTKQNNFIISSKGESYLEKINSELEEEQIKKRTLKLSEEANIIAKESNKNSKIANIIAALALILSVVALLISLLKK